MRRGHRESKLSADQGARCLIGRRRLEEELDTISVFGRDDRQPPTDSQIDVLFLLEAEDVCVELECLCLVVDEHAGHDDAQCHELVPFESVSHRSSKCSRGAVWR